MSNVTQPPPEAFSRCLIVNSTNVSFTWRYKNVNYESISIEFMDNVYRNPASK